MRQRTILIVDDNKTNLQIVKSVLEPEYKVLLALSGDMALKFVSKQSPDLILLDLHMPGMSGKEVMGYLMEDPATAEIPVIFLTADGSGHTESECLELGAADFITKPIVPRVLLSRIEKTFELEVYHHALQETIDRKTREAEEMSLQSIEAIAHTIDAKDEETNGHSRRVAQYSRAIAARLGYADATVETVYRSALLHDVGKIGIPDSILKKEGTLTEEEYAKIKEHTIIGADILSVITTVDHLSDGAHYHHEHYDGTGYPEGLAGGDIPMIGRIVAVSDVYDALVSRRRYKGAMTQMEVRAEIERCSGTQFDPDVVKAFFQLLDEGLSAE